MTERATLRSVVAGAVLLAGCAGAAGPVPGEGRRIEIEMRAFAFAPRAVVIEAGERVTLLLRNTDTVEHELMAGREPAADGGYKQDLLALFGVAPTRAIDHGMGHGLDAAAIRVAPGRTETVSFTVPGAFGRHEIGCFLEGHYDAGMKGVITIEVPGAPRETPGPVTSGLPRPVATLPPQRAPSATTAPMPSGDPMDMEGH